MKKVSLITVIIAAALLLNSGSVQAKHISGNYSAYGDRIVTIDGDGVSKPGTYKISEIENMEGGQFTGVYTMQTLVEPHSSTYTGVRLKFLLEDAGLKAGAKSVKIFSSDGISMEFTIDEIMKEDYINNSGGKNLPVILAYSKGDTPLVPDKSSAGYAADKGNDGGPLRLVVGQASPGERNSPKWLQNVVKITVGTTDAGARYSDIGNMFSWASDAIYDLSQKGIVSGTGDAKFEPERQVSRAEFSAMVVGAFNIGITKAYSGKYDDVQPGAWYADYVEAVTGAGVLQGTSNKQFSPDGLLTRNQVAVIMVNIIGEKTQAPAAARNAIGFKDKDKIPDWSVGSVRKCEELNIFDNIAVGYFNGDAPINRAEAAVIIHRVMSLK